MFNWRHYSGSYVLVTMKKNVKIRVIILTKCLEINFYMDSFIRGY